MKREELKQYAELAISMSLDVVAGKLDAKMFQKNLDLISEGVLKKLQEGVSSVGLNKSTLIGNIESELSNLQQTLELGEDLSKQRKAVLEIRIHDRIQFLEDLKRLES